MGFFTKRNKDREGVQGRAIVVYYGGVNQASGAGPPDGATTGKANAKADVRLVNGDGRVETVKGWLPQWVTWLMAEGDEIPVRVDPASGSVIAFDRGALKTEYQPRKGELKQDQKRRSSFRFLVGVEKGDVADLRDAASDLGNLPGQMKEALNELPAAGGGLRDDDPALAPIEGVGFETWVAVQAAVVRERVAPRDHDALAQRHGVPLGRWTDVQAAWMARMNGNPGLAQRFGEAYQSALK